MPCKLQTKASTVHPSVSVPVPDCITPRGHLQDVGRSIAEDLRLRARQSQSHLLIVCEQGLTNQRIGGIGHGGVFEGWSCDRSWVLSHEIERHKRQ